MIDTEIDVVDIVSSNDIFRIIQPTIIAVIYDVLNNFGFYKFCDGIPGDVWVQRGKGESFACIEVKCHTCIIQVVNAAHHPIQRMNDRNDTIPIVNNLTAHNVGET